MIVRQYEDDEFAIHRAPIIMAGAFVAITLTLTAAVSFGFLERQAVPSEAREISGTQVVASRSLLFFDERDGTVRVEDAATREELASFGPGTGGFVRSTVRSLVYQRRINGIGRATPFELIDWENGALTLRDSTTGKTVELGSFGDGNRQTFANFLEKETN